MTRTRSLGDGGGDERARPTAAEASIAIENRLLRQQVQDLSGQLTVLTDVVQQIACQMATLVTASQTPAPGRFCLRRTSR